MKAIKFLIIILLMSTVVIGIANSTSVTKYITTIKNQQEDSFNSDWKSTVNKYAIENNILPIEPRIDKIWKLIPGYNGLVIDEKSTLDLIEKKKTKSKNKITYIWHEVEPKNKLNDLGAFPIYRGNQNKPMVAFMINVAWGTEYLDGILDTLKREQVKSTFFLDGSWLSKNPDMARRIVEEGHEIGNHAYTHPQMSKLSSDRIKQEIVKTENLIKEVTGKKSNFFAPPSGDYDQRVVDIAYQLHLKTVLWTLDTVDWKKPTVDTILNRVLPNVNNGNLILMHPTESTAKSLPKLIKEIKKKGLFIGTVEDTLSSNRILPVESINNF